MMHLVIDRWMHYFQSRKEVNKLVKFWSPVNVGEISDSPAVLFKAIARTDKQLPDNTQTYPALDIIIRVIATSNTSEWDAFCQADIIADRLTALIRLNSKLYDRHNIFKDKFRYFLSTSDMIGCAYEEESKATNQARAGTYQKEVKLFLRCYQAHTVEGMAGVTPTCKPPETYDMRGKFVDWETGNIILGITGETVGNITDWGCKPITQEDAEEFLGWYMPEDQVLGMQGVERGNIFLKVFIEGELEAEFDMELKKVELHS
jgi:hypothetical protein